MTRHGNFQADTSSGARGIVCLSSSSPVAASLTWIVAGGKCLTSTNPDRPSILCGMTTSTSMNGRWMNTSLPASNLIQDTDDDVLAWDMKIEPFEGYTYEVSGRFYQVPQQGIVPTLL